jgi:hypothetical protein
MASPIEANWKKGHQDYRGDAQMNRLKAFAISSCLGLLAVAFLPSSRADEWNKKTVLTVNEQIAIPGAVLEPGKYVMKLADSQSNRHIVQVFNEDESKLITTVLAIPNYRLEPTGETQFGYWEMPAGQPRALKAWFYPGDNFGQEFAYPKDIAAQIAKTSGENVPAVTSNGENMQQAEVKEITPSGEEREMEQQSAQGEKSQTQQPAENQQQAQTAEEPAQPQGEVGSTRTGTGENQTSTTAERQGAEAAPEQPSSQATEQSQTTEQNQTAETNTAVNGQTAQNQGAQTTEEQTAQAQPESNAQQLPRTASPMPLVGLAGLLSAAAAMVARAAARRS